MATKRRSTQVPARPADTSERIDPDALWRKIESADRAAARARVAALRRKYPRASAATLHRRLVQAKCVQAGAVGAISGLAAFLPGPFRVLGSALGPLADATLVTTLQGELVLETFALHDVDMPQSAERFAVFAIAASNVGTVAVSHRLASSLAHFASRSLGGRVLATAAPIVALATTVAANIGLTYAIGQRAVAVAKLRDASFAEWPELLRSVTDIDERKLATWARQSAQAAVGQVGAAARGWMRRVGTLLPGRRSPRKRAVKSARKAARGATTGRSGNSRTTVRKAAVRDPAIRKTVRKPAAKRTTPAKKVARKKST